MNLLWARNFLQQLEKTRQIEAGISQKFMVTIITVSLLQKYLLQFDE